MQVADREAQRVGAVEPCMRDEDLAGPVHRVEEAFVECVATLRTEADDAEWHWCSTLAPLTAVDPRREQSCQPHVLGQAGPDTVRAEVPEHHPEFQRTKPPSELNPRVHEVP